MNLEQLVINEESSVSVDTEEKHWTIDAEPSNIISLAERGLLDPELAAKLEEFTYNDYSPLNEW